MKHKLCTFPGPSRNLVWDEKSIYFLSGASLNCVSTASMVYQIDLEMKTWARFSNGDVDCAEELRKIGDKILIKIESGLHDEIRLSDQMTLYRVPNKITTWDSHSGHEVFAMGKSSINDPPELYTIHNSRNCQLTSHNELVSNLSIATTYQIHVVSPDGTSLDALLFTPTDPQRTRPWPTFVGIHGGPYDRITNALMYPNTHGDHGFAHQATRFFAPITEAEQHGARNLPAMPVLGWERKTMAT